MLPARSAYLWGALAVVGSRVVSVAAGFASLWLVSQILSKDMLGGYAFAFNVVLLATPLATCGLERSLLLRIASEPSDDGTLAGGRLALETALLTLASAALVGTCLALFADDLAHLGAIAQGAFWLGALAWSVVPFAVTSVLQSWFQANHRVSEAVAVPGIGDAGRCLFFAVVFTAGLGAAGVAWAVTLAAALPAAVLVALSVRRFVSGALRLHIGDLRPAANFLVTRFASQASARAGIVLLGLLATATATAEYAIAAQLALLADAGRMALKPSFAPRIRFHLSRKDLPRAAAEYEGARFWAQAGALIAAAGLVLLSDPILAVFGDFQEARGPLLLLAASYVVMAGAGMHTTYLNMTGETGWSALLRSFGFALLVGLGVLLIPTAGAYGAAWAVLLATVAVEGAGLLLVRRLTEFAAIGWGSAVAVLVAAAVLVLAAHRIVPADLAAGILLISVIGAAVQRREVQSALRQIRTLFAGWR